MQPPSVWSVNEAWISAKIRITHCKNNKNELRVRRFGPRVHRRQFKSSDWQRSEACESPAPSLFFSINIDVFDGRFFFSSLFLSLARHSPNTIWTDTSLIYYWFMGRCLVFFVVAVIYMFVLCVLFLIHFQVLYLSTVLKIFCYCTTLIRFTWLILVHTIMIINCMDILSLPSCNKIKCILFWIQAILYDDYFYFRYLRNILMLTLLCSYLSSLSYLSFSI